MKQLVRFDPRVGEVTPTGLVLRDGITFDAWQEIGGQLRQAEKAVLWWIGDWLNYGERAYGEMYAQALDTTDYSIGTLQNAKWVASRIETSLRSELVSYKVHQEVASLTAEQQAEILHEAERDNLTVRDVRERVNSLKRGIRSAPAMPAAGTYSLIYADPPWRYEHSKTDSRRIENQYPTMDLDEICTLPVANLAADDCVLFMWATSPKLAEAMSVVEYWSVYRDGKGVTPGWVAKDLACDYIAYAWVPTERCLLLPFQELRRVWRKHCREWVALGERGSMGFFIAHAPNNGYETISVCVPEHVLLEAIKDSMLIKWSNTFE